MLDLLTAPRRAPSLTRRLFTAALLALQVAIAFSSIAEKPVSGRMVAHVHDQQRRHAAAHDESTCVVCAARAQVAVAAPPATPAIETERDHASAPAANLGAPVFAQRGVPSSRAPPVLG